MLGVMAACSSDDDDPGSGFVPQPSERTVIVYMAGENNLTAYVVFYYIYIGLFLLSFILFISAAFIRCGRPVSRIVGDRSFRSSDCGRFRFDPGGAFRSSAEEL